MPEIKENSIGNKRFLSLTGTPLPPSVQPVVDQRPGVDGTIVTLTGERGMVFRLLSLVDAADYQAGRQLIEMDYQAMVGADPVPMTQGGVDSDGLGYKVAVLGVRPLRVRAVRTVVGGLSPASGALVDAEWTLVAVKNQ